MDCSKKCKTCAGLDNNKSKSLKLEDMWCSKYNDWCKSHYIDCEHDKRVFCGLCSHFGEKEEDYCSKDGRFKDGDTPRICNNGFNKK